MLMKKQEKFKRSFIDLPQKKMLDKSIKKLDMANS